MNKKFYGLRKFELPSNIHIKILKFLLSSKWIFILKKDLRKRKRSFYKSVYNDSRLNRKNNNAIPENGYYIPISTVISDLIPKDSINKLSKNLKKLYLKNHSNKFLGGLFRIDDLTKFIYDMNTQINSANSWTLIESFDFDNNRKLKKLVDYFDIKIKNYCSSYFAIEITVFYSKDLISKLKKLIEQDCSKSYWKPLTQYSQKRHGGGLKKSKSLTSLIPSR